MQKITKNINPVVLKTSNGRTMILSKFATCGAKKSISIEKQDSSRILSNLGLKTPLNRIPLLDDILF